MHGVNNINTLGIPFAKSLHRVPELAALLGITRRAVKYDIAKGLLPVTKICRGWYEINDDELDAWLTFRRYRAERRTPKQ